MGTRRATLAWALAAAAAIGPLRPARADGFLFQFEEGFRAGENETRAPGAEPSSTSAHAFTQRYRLNLDRTLYPYLTLSAGGFYDWIQNWAEAADQETQAVNRRWNGNLRLSIGPPVMNGALTYDRTQNDASTRVRGQAWLDSPTLVREVYGGTAAWRPAGLPSLDLVASRSDDHDDARRLADRISTEVGLGAFYREIRNWDLRASLRYATLDDRIGGVETSELAETAFVGWGDRFLDRRLTTSATYSIGRRDSKLTARRPDAVVTTVQTPFEALSLVEAVTAVPTFVTLLVNPALADANVSASAGLDIGYGVRPSDARLRDLGVRFANTSTPVNRVYVYVDRPIPVAVWPLFTWRAFQSDDNVTWTELPGVGPVAFGLFDNRFEITIPRTEARYLKVVVAPLLTGATTAPELATILVTELQTLLVEPAAAREGKSSDVSGTLTAAARLLMNDKWNFAADSALFYTHGSRDSWSLANGLSAGRRFNAWSHWAARLDRTDSGDQRGDHTAVSRISGSLLAEPLPTLGGSATAGASLTEDRDGTGWSTSVSALAHADLYRGVALAGNVSAGLGEPPGGTLSRSYSAALSASVVPHPTTALTGSYSLNGSELVARDGRKSWDRRSRVEGAISFSPFPALALAGSVARNLEAPRTTQTNLSLGFSPFQGGALALRFGYSDGYDTGTDQRARSWGPGLRLTLRPGWYVDSSYTVESTRSPAVETDGRSFLATLTGTLR